MVYCVKARLLFSTAARRDAVLADVQTRIAGKPKWGLEEAEAFSSFRGQPVNGLAVELRFTSKADAVDLKARVDAFAVGPRQPEPGSWLTLHDCPHDGAAGSCLVEARSDW